MWIGGILLNEEFISARDRIVAASIDIISDAGLVSLSMKSISMRTNISEAMLYKYYADTDEILSDIITTYFKFDSGLYKTLRAKECSYIKKVLMFAESLASYYENYYSISAIMLQYEELLHNVKTREAVEYGYVSRRQFLTELMDNAKENNEINASLKSEEIVDLILGTIHICIFSSSSF